MQLEANGEAVERMAAAMKGDSGRRKERLGRSCTLFRMFWVFFCYCFLRPVVRIHVLIT